MRKCKLIAFHLIASSALAPLFFQTILAETLQKSGSVIEFQGRYPQEVYDPENPTIVVNPGESPKTTGDLRIDFAPQLDFGSNPSSSKDVTAYSNAQLFHGEAVESRGNFVQVSDYRGTGEGWSLQVKQETQFRNEKTENKELKGAVLSFDQSWTNSTRNRQEAPEISKDVIRIDNIGITYNLAEAKKGAGEGTWAISFGSSNTNPLGQPNSLTPRLDQGGAPQLSPIFNQQAIFKNEAVSLRVPGATSVDPVPYQTVLTWTLSELP